MIESDNAENFAGRQAEGFCDMLLDFKGQVTEKLLRFVENRYQYLLSLFLLM
jgi:hypothetical protein